MQDALYFSVYFSAVTYTTVGYGDLVVPKPHRVCAAYLFQSSLANDNSVKGTRSDCQCALDST